MEHGRVPGAEGQDRAHVRVCEALVPEPVPLQRTLAHDRRAGRCRLRLAKRIGHCVQTIRDCPEQRVS